MSRAFLPLADDEYEYGMFGSVEADSPYFDKSKEYLQILAAVDAYLLGEAGHHVPAARPRGPRRDGVARHAGSRDLAVRYRVPVVDTSELTPEEATAEVVRLTGLTPVARAVGTPRSVGDYPLYDQPV